MKAREIGSNILLENAGIDQATERIERYLSDLGLERREIARLRLSAENILLAWQARFGKNASARLSCYVRLGQPLIRLVLENDPFNPLAQTDEMNEWGINLMSRLATQPIYSYSRGQNVVTFKVVTKKRNPFLLLLFALAAAVAAGLLGNVLPPSFKTGVAENWMTILCNTYLNVLGFVGLPLIFLSVALGIVGVGDVNTFGKIGRRMVRHNTLVLLVVATLSAAIAYPFFRFTLGDNSLHIVYTDILNMVLGWLPTGLLQPFLNSNAIQLIIMGVIFGIGLLKLDPLAKNLYHMLDDLNNLLLLVSEWMTKLIPAFVFITLVRSFWMGTISEILPVWKPWAVTIGLEFAMLLFMIVQVCVKHRIRPRILIKKLSATFLIALGTNSCTASIVENYACCAEKLGLDSKVFIFGIPFSTSTFKPASAVRMVVLAYFVASAYRVSVSPVWFFLTVLFACIFSVAVPAIPGGILMFCPMLFSQLSLPAEAVAPVLATDIFFDAFCTAANQAAAQLALIQEGGKMDMLNAEILKKPVG